MNATARAAATSTPTAELVPDEHRMDFLPTLFGLRLLMVGENAVYSFLKRLSPDYGGGFWEFLQYEGKPLYLRPASDRRFRMACEPNDYGGEVSADAAGVIATLFALSHLSFSDPSDRMAKAYQRLYAFAAHHPEAPEIFAAID
ncbi:antirestriction protein [Aureimonas ureilytica]|uniref:Antirestriction protein n=1 Tax=Aureimonas ureilytica TaxID=401562 RepID=A0A175R979_9HYPH|nr:antirestriction protein [Aureimonas ureilytica]KTQ96326.1 antirestriction protein [Aureimonas ureilytica]